VIDAMCLPAAARVDLFPGAHRLISTLSGQARVVIVSNTMWRGRHAVRCDFEQFGLAGYVSDYVMSIDVGWRKPDTRFFAAAVACGGGLQPTA
jgi:FMN phosphatase YigB (HAD superfamily)